MMKFFVAVTKFLKSEQNMGFPCYNFHFSGFYEGHHIKKIKVISQNLESFIRGNDYLLYLRFYRMSDNTLEAHLIKSKAIEQIS